MAHLRFRMGRKARGDLSYENLQFIFNYQNYHFYFVQHPLSEGSFAVFHTSQRAASTDLVRSQYPLAIFAGEKSLRGFGDDNGCILYRSVHCLSSKSVDPISKTVTTFRSELSFPHALESNELVVVKLPTCEKKKRKES